MHLGHEAKVWLVFRALRWWKSKTLPYLVLRCSFSYCLREHWQSQQQSRLMALIPTSISCPASSASLNPSSEPPSSIHCTPSKHRHLPNKPLNSMLHKLAWYSDSHSFRSGVNLILILIFKFTFCAVQIPNPNLNPNGTNLNLNLKMNINLTCSMSNFNDMYSSHCV